MSKIVFFVGITLIVLSCNLIEQPQGRTTDYHEFQSFSDFRKTLSNIIAIADPVEKETSLSIFWDSLKANNQIPFAFKDSVAFLYKGGSASVAWAGDFSGWSPIIGSQIGNSDVWMLEKTFPLDARLDYKIVLDNNWMLDPANSQIQYSGFGPNSELRMPAWEYPEETILGDGVNRGVLSENILMSATNNTLGYNLQYKVYTPFGYDQLTNLPVMYVADGQEYSDDRLGSMLIILDNLIHQQLITPIIVIFMDPRNPDNLAENRRGDQYTGNPKFVDFVADELVPVIDADYKTDNNADARAILGTSYGGWNAGYFGVKRSDKFHLIGIHSPAFDDNVINDYKNAELLPLKIFMSTGVINDTQDKARAMKEVMETKGYPLNYVEVNEGHSWGNWRALIKAPLLYFFSN